MSGFLQRRLHRQLDLHDNRRPERERLMQRQLHLPHHVHGLVLGQLQQRHLRSQMPRRRRGEVDTERRKLPLIGSAERADAREPEKSALPC